MISEADPSNGAQIPEALKKKNPNTELEVYWEKQGVNKLCGLHTLNALL